MTLQEAILMLEANGWAVVPVRPTPEMLREGWYGPQSEDLAAETWRYMLSATPKAVEIQGQKVVLSRASSGEGSGPE